MLKVYGFSLSLPSNKVRYVANHMGLDYEFVPVNLLAGEHMSEEHMKLHPAGKVPAIDDDGFVLFESGSIIKYLAQKYDSSLYPVGLKEGADVDKWTDFVSIHVNNGMNRVFFNRILAPLVGVEVDERSMKDGLSFLDRFLPVVENQLSENVYLAGDELTLADFNLLSVLDPAEAAQVDLSPYPSITNWRSRLQKEDFYTKCHSSYTEALQSAA
jgi:glutathione S-transferase